MPAPLPDAAWKRSFRGSILRWYRRHARDLPWRASGDPYRVWVSEIMLQQTQVATVTPYFTRFIQAFPTVEDLARAAEQDVLRLWEGLGYYRRARQLHEAARRIMKEHGGRFPQDPEAVRRLPGIGRYTAGAILSIAFDAREPILEANTVRLHSRLLAYRGDPLDAAGQRLLWSLAENLLPARGAGRFNQALMELGSTVCLPREPRCEACPAAVLCPTNLQGLQAVIPPAARKPPIEAVREAAVVVYRRGRVLVLQNAPGQRWAGLWDFPRFPVAAGNGPATRDELVSGVQRLTGVLVEPGERLTTIKHSVTRFRITLDCHRAEYVAGSRRNNGQVPFRWLKPAELEDYPLSTTGRKIGQLLG
ncbi:MAG: A/G-specific adenine glycosylase [Pirellulales bacterium]